MKGAALVSNEKSGALTAGLVSGSVTLSRQVHDAVVRLMLVRRLSAARNGRGSAVVYVFSMALQTQNVLRNDDPFRIQIGAGIFSLFTSG